MTATKKVQSSLVCVCALIAVVVVLSIAFIMMCAFVWRDITPRGPLATEADWPEPVREMHSTLANADVELRSFAVFLLWGEPGNTLSSVVCRMDGSSVAMSVLASHLALKPITHNQAANWAGNETLRYTSTDWWTPDEEENAEYYASNNLVIGHEGDQYVVAHDLTRNLAFIHYSFNY